MTEVGEPLPAADDELWALVEAFVDGTATPGDRDRLEGRLRAESGARWFYVAYLDLHAHLQWRMRGDRASAAPSRLESARRLLRLPARPAALFLALAVSLLIVVLVRSPRPGDVEPPDLPDVPAGSVAVLIDNHHTVWEADNTLPTETGSALPPGRLKLKEGVVEIAFLGGGEVLLEGPADFEVRAPDHGCLHQGKLTARVPSGAPAFRVNMPGVMVTDHNGECGLVCDAGDHSEVHVFEGQVDAGLTDRPGAPVPGMRLTENAGARVDAGQQTLTPLPLNERAFAHLRPEIRVADASVRGGQFAGRNFGMACRLRVKNTIPDYSWETYLCFDLAGISGNVREARVRLVPAQVGQPFENAAALVADNRWKETTITWDNKPASGPAFARWLVTAGVPVEFDVTRFVREALAGDKKLSLRIFAPNFERRKSYAEYGSRKGEVGRRPQLLVTVSP